MSETTEGLDTLLDLVKRRDNLSETIHFMCSSFPWRVLADAGLKIEAIRSYRTEKGCDLLDAKKVVDEYMDIPKERLA